MVLIPPGGHLTGRLLPDVIVQDADLAALFKQRDKVFRIDHAQLRMLPPDQRFRAGKLRFIRPDIIFGLVIHCQLVIVQRVGKIVQQALVAFFPLLHGRVIDHGL